IIIALQQVPLALGVPTPDGETATLVAARALRIASPEVTVPALAVVTLVIAVMIVLPRIRRSLPASLIAVVVATVVVEVAGLDVARIGAIPASLPAPSIPVLNTAQTSELFSAALAVAALAALESLLAARVADG